MRYGIDLDGVLANFGRNIPIVGNQLWPGRFPENPDDFRPTEWSAGLSKEEERQLFEAIAKIPYFWENQYELPGCQELTAGIKDDEVYFVTARAITVGESPLVQSARWLRDRHLWPRRGYSTVIPVAHAGNKVELFRGLGLKFMLDDFGPTVEQLNTIDGMHAFVLDAPYNRRYESLPRVYSVTEYLDTIHKLA